MGIIHSLLGCCNLADHSQFLDEQGMYLQEFFIHKIFIFEYIQFKIPYLIELGITSPIPPHVGGSELQVPAAVHVSLEVPLIIR